MKRKIAAIVSIGTALAMSLFLCACGDEDNKRPTPDTPEPAPVVLTATEKLDRGITLLSGSQSLSGTVSTTIESDNAEKAVHTGTYVKNGDSVKVSYDASEYYFDLKTGEGYYPAEDEGFTPFVAPEWYGDVAEIINALPDKIESGELDDYITESDGAVKLAFDYKKEANKYLEILGDYYDGSLYDIANEFVASDGKIIDEVLDDAVTMLSAFKYSSASLMIATIDTQLKNLGTDITFKQIFIKAGVTEEEYAAVSRRMAGEMLAGAIPVINDLIDTATDCVMNGGSFEDIDIAAEVKNAFDAMFVDEIPQAAIDSLDDDLRDMKTKLISMLKTVKVNSVVDMLVEKTGIDDIREMAANAVTFTKLKAEFTVRFDDNGCISSVSYAAFIAHNYKPAAVVTEGTETDENKKPSVLDDNNYTITGTVSFDTAETDAIVMPSVSDAD